MTDQAQGQGNWHDWEAKPLPVAESPTSIPITEQTKMNDLEDADMIRSLVSRIGDYLVERTKLAERVREAEEQIANLQSEVQSVQMDLANERDAHRASRTELDSVKAGLDHERSTVAQLVGERDLVRDQLRETQEALSKAKEEISYYVSEAQRLEKERNEATHAADVCREQREQMAGQVGALKAAFGALRVLE